MLIVIKIILVAFAVFGQAKLFPEHAASAESALDTLVLPVDKPERVLAKRAMEAQGICPNEEKAEASMAAWDATGRKPEPASGTRPVADSAAAPQSGSAGKRDLATNCF